MQNICLIQQRICNYSYVVLLHGQIRKRDWSEQGQLLKVRIHKKLSVYQAAARLQIKTLASLDTEGKSSKRLLHGALALLIESAEACLFSVWRKLRACEELFGCLLSGICQAAAIRGGQLLRVLLIRFKPLVVATCTQVYSAFAEIDAPLRLVSFIISSFHVIVLNRPTLQEAARDPCLEVC